MSNPNVRLVIAGATLSTVAACGGQASEAAPESPAPTTSQTPNTVVPSATSEAAAPELVFDDLNGGSGVIDVYEGPSESSHDRAKNGTYYDDQRVTALCKIAGRLVASHPERGEEDRQSMEWIFFRDTNKVGHYATATYIERPQYLLKQLPEC